MTIDLETVWSSTPGMFAKVCIWILTIAIIATLVFYFFSVLKRFTINYSKDEEAHTLESLLLTIVITLFSGLFIHMFNFTYPMVSYPSDSSIISQITKAGYKPITSDSVSNALYNSMQFSGNPGEVSPNFATINIKTGKVFNCNIKVNPHKAITEKKIPVTGELQCEKFNMATTPQKATQP